MVYAINKQYIHNTYNETTNNVFG